MKYKFYIIILILVFAAIFLILPSGINIKQDFISSKVEDKSFKQPLDQAVFSSIRPKTSIKSDEAKSIYLTTWVFTNKNKREKLIKLADETEINSLVINIKDSDGVTLYSLLKDEETIKLIDGLHKKNLYLIARVSVFQDRDLVKKQPELSLKYSDGRLWRDRGGYYWLDPASQEVWKYTLDLSKKAIDLGFDEIQLDYIRFPSEGKLDKVIYPFYDGKMKKSEIIGNFMKYFSNEIKKYNPEIIISADIFGYTFLRGDDLGIGQILKNILEYFDYVSPMVYPSHYSSGNFGFKNPAEHPYEVIKNTLEEGTKILAKQLGLVSFQSQSSSVSPSTSSSSLAKGDSSSLKLKEFDPKILAGFKTQIRPWLQDFNLGATYDAQKIKLQKQAVYDFGVDTWMLWNPNNVYTSGGLEKL